MSKKVKITLFVIFIISLVIGLYYFIDKKIENEIVRSITNKIKKIDLSAEVSYEKISRKGLIKPTLLSFSEVQVKTAHHKINSDKIIIQLDKDKISNIKIDDLILNIKSKGKNDMPLHNIIAIEGETSVNMSYKDGGEEYDFFLPRVTEISTVEQKYVLEFNEEFQLSLKYDKDSLLKSFQYTDQGANLYNDKLAEENIVSKSGNNRIIINRFDEVKYHLYDIDISTNSSAVSEENSEDSESNEYVSTSMNFKGNFKSNRKNEDLLKILNIESLNLNFYGSKMLIMGNISQDWQNILPFGYLTINLDKYKDIISSIYNLDNEEINMLYDKKIFFSDIEESRLLTFLEKLNGNESDFLSIRLERDKTGPIIVNNFTIKMLLDLYKEIVKPGNIEPILENDSAESSDIILDEDIAEQNEN